MPGHWGKDIPSMECGADLRKEIFFIGETYDLLHLISECNKGEETIVWAHKKIVCGHKENGFSQTSHLWIHHGEMDGSFWKIRVGVGQEESPLFYIVWDYLMRDINQG